MEYDYTAAARRLEVMRAKVRQIKVADGTYKDVGLPEVVELENAEAQPVKPIKSKKKSGPWIHEITIVCSVDSCGVKCLYQFLSRRGVGF